MSKKHADLIVAANQVVTCAGSTQPKTKVSAHDIGLIADGAVAIVHGEIQAVGPQADIFAHWNGDKLHLPSTTLIPGLVDPHCHPIWVGDRKPEFALRAQGASYEEIHAAGGGIAHTVAATRQASDDELLSTTLKRLERMLSHGTTTIEAKSGYGLSTAEELRQLQILKTAHSLSPMDMVMTCLGAHALPVEYHNDRESFLEMIIDELLPQVKSQHLAQFVDVFCERGAFSCEESRQVLQRAKELGFGLRIHAEEFSSLGGSRMAAELGATSCDHLQHLPADDFPVLKDHGTIPIVIPGTSFFLDLADYAPARAMWDANLPVALGTDFNAGSCLLESMSMAMSLAVLKMKMTPEEAMTAATINAAFSLGLGHKIGSLEPGKQADMVLWDGVDFRDILYRFGSNSTRAVIKKGVVLNTILRSPLGAPL